MGKELEVTGHFLRGRRTTKSLLQERLEISTGRFGFGGRRFDRRLLRGWIPDIHRLARDGFAGTGSLSFHSGERLIVKAREGNGAPGERLKLFVIARHPNAEAMLGLVRPREAAGAQQFAIRMNLCASVDHIKQGVMPLAIVHARAGFQITQPTDVVDQPAALDVKRLGVRHPFASGGGLGKQRSAGLGLEPREHSKRAIAHVGALGLRGGGGERQLAGRRRRARRQHGQQALHRFVIAPDRLGDLASGPNVFFDQQRLHRQRGRGIVKATAFHQVLWQQRQCIELDPK